MNRVVMIYGIIVTLFIHITTITAASQAPFFSGYSMGNNGTIMKPFEMSGRQPWIPAGYFADTLKSGLSACGIDYFDIMDNYKNDYIGEVAVGAWGSYGRFIIKAAYSYFNALDIYNEHMGFGSIGCRIKNHMCASIDVTGFRAGLADYPSEHETYLHAGATLFISGQKTGISIACNHLPLKTPKEKGFEPSEDISAGIYAYVNRLGAQGITLKLFRQGGWQCRFSMGEEMRLAGNLYVCGAIATNPLTMHFGFTVYYSHSGISLSLADHPVLGWSKGLTIDYARK
jgi:hypothetical protein